MVDCDAFLANIRNARSTLLRQYLGLVIIPIDGMFDFLMHFFKTG